MNRRELILILGGAMTATHSSGAQQKKMPVIGYLGGTSPDAMLAAFRQGLNETGYVEGQNVAIEYRWAENATIGCPLWPPTSSAAGST